jgi:pimeloyl-ACP methyl ester carboxylesterase
MKVLVNGQLIGYKDEGKGRVLVLLHGWGDQMATFNELAAHLAKNFRVIRLDFPGFGTSPRPADTWTVGDYANITSEFLTKLGIADVYAVIGHSFGGRVIIKSIGDNILRPKKVVLIGAAGVKPKQSSKKVAYRAVAKVGKVVTSLPGLRGTRQVLRQKLYESAGNTDYLHAEGMQAIFRNTVNEDLLPLVHLITQPSLLVWGENDDQTPVADAYSMSNELDDSELMIVENAGHFVFLDEPALVEQKIDEFLK